MKAINSLLWRLKQIRWVLVSIVLVVVLVLGRVAFNKAHEIYPYFDVLASPITLYSKPDVIVTGKQISFHSDGDWTAISNVPGMNLSPSHGKRSSKINIMNLTFDTHGLTIGSYKGTVTISKINSTDRATISVTLYVTEAEIGQVADIRIIGDPTSVITLEDATATYGALSYLAMNPWGGSSNNPGDICLEISGVFRNNSTSEFIDYWAEGYDANGEQIAWTLSSGAIVGHANVSIPLQETGNFTLTLSWAEGISEIKLFMNAYGTQPP